MSASGAASPFVPIAEAAAATGVPARTLYRWARSKAVSSRREGDVVLVDLEAAQAHAARRLGATPLPVVAGAPAGNGAVAGAVTRTGSGSADGERSAEIVSLLDEGRSPVEVVKATRQSPATVLAVARDFKALQSASGGNVGNKNAVDELEGRIAALERRIGSGPDSPLVEQYRLNGVEVAAQSLVARIHRLEVDVQGAGPQPPLVEWISELKRQIDALRAEVATIPRAWCDRCNSLLTAGYYLWGRCTRCEQGR